MHFTKCPNNFSVNVLKLQTICAWTLMIAACGYLY